MLEHTGSGAHPHLHRNSIDEATAATVSHTQAHVTTITLLLTLTGLDTRFTPDTFLAFILIQGVKKHAS